MEPDPRLLLGESCGRLGLCQPNGEWRPRAQSPKEDLPAGRGTWAGGHPPPKPVRPSVRPLSHTPGTRLQRPRAHAGHMPGTRLQRPWAHTRHTPAEATGRSSLLPPAGGAGLTTPNTGTNRGHCPETKAGAGREGSAGPSRAGQGPVCPAAPRGGPAAEATLCIPRAQPGPLPAGLRPTRALVLTHRHLLAGYWFSGHLLHKVPVLLTQNHPTVTPSHSC